MKLERLIYIEESKGKTMTILEASNIVKVYREFNEEGEMSASNGVNLSVKKSEFVAIMGPSGSGKTTLLTVLSGIDQPTSGEVIIEGQKMNEMTDDALAQFRRRSLGFVFQDFNLVHLYLILIWRLKKSYSSYSL